MQIKRDEKMKEEGEISRIKESRKQDFRERQAQKRAKAREDATYFTSKERDPSEIEDCIVEIPDSELSRPASALTETGEKKRQEDMDKAEERELIAFVDDLDVEKTKTWNYVF